LKRLATLAATTAMILPGVAMAEDLDMVLNWVPTA